MSHSAPFRLSLGCSAIALATALASPAQAQSAGSFQGSGTVTFGSANISTGSTTTTVQVNSTSAVIDWTPFDTAISAGSPINFQPAGTTATFQNNPTGQNQFAVLNRIVPTDTSRPVRFEGTVLSRLQQASAVVPGGTVFFYSPAGILVGPSAVFDVGQLGLTTAPPVVDGNGNWYTGNTVQFGQSVSTGRVAIFQGAQITASSEGSYVAAFAPVVEQIGSISVNGQAAFVAAEAGSITFSPDGLFNISVSVGSDETFAIRHRGTTTGPASSGAGDNHRIYMVAVPKNNAMQLLIERGSSIGFAIAGAANVQGNAVVLSAGRNIAGGQISEAPVGGPGEARITINDSNTTFAGTGIDFTSSVVARALDVIDLQVFRQTNFASDAVLRGDVTAQVSLSSLTNEPPGALTVGGSLTVSARATQTRAGSTVDAGTAVINYGGAGGSTLSVANDLNILASVNADRSGNGEARGGTAQLNFFSPGSLSVGRDLIVDATAVSDGAPGSPSARGGQAGVNLQSGGNVSVGRVARIISYGIAGLNNGASGQGRQGAGGSSSLAVAGGSVFTTNELNMAADGVGGANVGSGAGTGLGGTASITVSGANSRLTVSSANVTGIASQGDLDFLSAEGFGGQNGIAGGVAGTGTGGTASINVNSGGTLNLPNVSGSNTRIFARGTGGNVLASAGTGTGGAAGGGTVSITANGGTVNGDARIIASSFALGGSTTQPAVGGGVINGGNATGGSRIISISNGATFNASMAGGGPGAQGGNGSASGTGGNGSGGTATTTVDNATLNVSTTAFSTFSQNVGGSGAVYGNAIGGTATATLSNNAVVNIASGLQFGVTSSHFTEAALFAGPAQSGGNVSAGTATLNINSGARIAGTGQVVVQANAGVGHNAVAGGNALGGTARLNMSGGSLQANSVLVTSDASGGSLLAPTSNISAANAGEGTGGDAFVVLQGATINAPSFTVRANGRGGEVDLGQSSGGAAGSGVGGRAVLQAASGTNTVTTTLMQTEALGDGGRFAAASGTGIGGNGTGGEARADALTGATLNLNAPFNAIAEGTGGNTNAIGVGGNGTGGRAYTFTAGGTLNLNGDVFVDAAGSGGSGDGGGAGAGGFAYVQSSTNGTTTVTGDVYADASGNAGFYRGPGATGGAATGGQAQVLATDGNARMTINGSVEVDAGANGGPGIRDAQGNGGPGGAATGGFAEIGGSVGTGNVVRITGNADIESEAYGGFGENTSGGNATGGRAFLSAGDGTSITVNGDVYISNSVYGGDAQDVQGTPTGIRGGDALGGQALIQTFGVGGAVRIDGSAYVDSNVFGGGASILGGTGGDATAGVTQMFARNGSISIGGDFFGTSSTNGGFGDTGGNALTRTDGLAEAAFLTAAGTISVTGDSNLFVYATGGDGLNGGAGGSAASGGVLVDANSNTAGPSTITLAGLHIDTFANGGNGGVGTGRAGGTGGNATAGSIQVFGTAGNGTLVVTGSTALHSFAYAGSGGTSDTQTGGRGGDAFSGNIQFGTKSGTDVGPQNAGSATFADMDVETLAYGGFGGDSTSGVGGGGGNGSAGFALFLVRGSPVTATDVSIAGLGYGGDGGSGTSAGAGGFGFAGGVSLTASNRFQRTERGQAMIGSLNMIAIGQGGSGSTLGASYYAGTGGVFLTQSDVTVTTLNYSNLGTSAPPATPAAPVQPIELALVSATMTVGSLSMSTPGEFRLNLDASTVTANTFAIAAGNFVLPPTAPTTPGTITVRDTLALTATAPGGAVRTYANLQSSGASSISSSDSIVLGNINSSGAFQATSTTGSVTVGNITAAAANLVAASSIQAGNIVTTGAFTAQSSSGSVAVTSASASAVTIATPGAVTVGAITAGVIDVTSNALVSVLGPWNSRSIDISAADIAIPDGGSLIGGSTGRVDLSARNATGAFIGDGLSGQGGYRLSNAEFARISGNTIFIAAEDFQANPVDLTIGTLTLAASQLPGTSGSIEFATGNATTFARSGRIRIDGAFTGTGFSSSQFVDFTTGSFELNAETGSLSLAGNGPGNLGGIVTIDAANIHVASPTLLNQLRADPRFTGVADAINAPSATQRPEGVLRALGLQLFPSDTLYIQNTGTASNPAGFYTTPDASDIEPPGFESSSAPDVDVLINGRFATATGDISGRDAFALITDDEESTFDGFSEASQFNGCAFSSTACGGGDETNSLATISSEISVLTGATVAEEPFDLDEGSEESASEEASEQEEQEEEQAAQAPIQPPVILINTSPLNPPLDIADPVSGSGNPAALTAEPDATGPGGGQ